MFGIRTPLFGCIVRVEFAFCLWHSCKVLAALLVSGLEMQSIFFFGLPLGFRSKFQNTKNGLAPLVQGTIPFSFDLRKSLFGLFFFWNLGQTISVFQLGLEVMAYWLSHCAHHSAIGASLVLDLVRDGTWCSFPLIVGNTINLFAKQAFSFVALPFYACMLKAYGKIASTKALA